MMEELLTPAELAGRYRCSKGRLAQWRFNKVGPAYIRHGGRILYRRSDIEKYERDNTFAGTSEYGRQLGGNW
jgi:hypothetical protein